METPKKSPIEAYDLSTPSTNPNSFFAGGLSNLSAFGSQLKATTDRATNQFTSGVKDVKDSVDRGIASRQAAMQTPGAAVGASAVNGISSASASASANVNESREPNDIPKEELIALCMKMSKKVKALQVQKKELTEQFKSEKTKNQTFHTFFTTEVVSLQDLPSSNSNSSSSQSNHSAEHEPDLLTQYRLAYNKADESRGFAIQTLQSEMQTIIHQHTATLERMTLEHDKQIELASIFDNSMAGGLISSGNNDKIEEVRRALRVEHEGVVTRLRREFEGKVENLTNIAQKQKNHNASIVKESVQLKDEVVRFERTKNELINAERQNESLLAEIATLKNNQNNTSNATAQQHETDLKLKTNECNNLTMKLSDLSSQIQTLKRSQSQIASITSTLNDEHLTEITTLKQQFVTFSNTKNESVKQLSSKSQECLNLTSQLNDTNVKLSTLSSTLNNLKIDLSTANATIETSEKRLLTLSNEHGKSIDEISYHQNRYVQLESTLHSNSDSSDILISQKVELEKVVSDVKSVCKGLEGELVVSGEKVGKLRREKEGLVGEIEEVKVSAKGEVEEMKGVLVAIKARHGEEMSALKGENETGVRIMAKEKKSEIDHLKIEQTNAIRSITDEHTSLLTDERNKAIESNIQIQSLKQELITANTSLQSISQGGSEQVTNLSTQLKQALAQHAIDRVTYQSDFDNVMSKLNASEGEKNKMIVDADDRKQEFNAAVEEMQKKLGTVSSVNGKLEDKIKEVEKASGDSNGKLKSQSAQLNKEKDELNSTLLNQTNTLKTLQKALDDATRSNKSMTSTIDSLKSDLSNNSSTSQSSANTINSINIQIQGKTQELLESEQTVLSLRGEVQSFNTRINELCIEQDNDTKRFASEHLSTVNSLNKRITDISANHDNQLSNTTNKFTVQLRQREDEISNVKSASDELSVNNEELLTKLRSTEVMFNSVSATVVKLEDELSLSKEQASQFKLGVVSLQEQSSALIVENASLIAQVDNSNELNSSVSVLQRENQALKTAAVTSTGLINRLQADLETGEVRYGQRTALVGVLENDIDGLKDKISLFESELDANKEQREELKAAVQDWERKEVTNDKLRSVNSDALRSAEDAVLKKHEAEISNLKVEMKKKSSAAQELFREKDMKYNEILREKTSLQKEVDLGSHSDRHILTIAQKQSNREASSAVEVAVRDVAVSKLMVSVAGQDGALADAIDAHDKLKAQLDEVMKRDRREDVNLDYLKSVVVQYLSLPVGSSERKALLRVIATLLQFSENDYESIEEGCNSVNWFWGKIVKEIKPKASVVMIPAVETAAAVEVSSGSGSGSVVRPPLVSTSTSMSNSNSNISGGSLSSPSSTASAAASPTTKSSISASSSPTALAASAISASAPSSSASTVAAASSSSSASSANVGEVKVSGITKNATVTTQPVDTAADIGYTRKKRTSMQF